MKKYFFTILFFSSISIFADSVSPQNYVNQVTSDCLAIENGINSLISTGADIPYIQDKILQIWTDVQYDSHMSQSAKDYIINYCQQAFYRLNEVKSSLEQINRNSASIRTVASNLDLVSSGSGGSSVTNNYYYNSSTTNFYNTSNNSFYNSFVTNNYYTTDNNFYNTFVTNLSFHSSFVTNISNYTEVDLTGVLSYLSSIEGLDTTFVSNFSDFLVAYSNTVSLISSIRLNVQNINSQFISFFSEWELNSQQLLNIYFSVNSINNSLYNINTTLTSISRSISSILSILPTWASRSIMFYDSMSIWTNSFWQVGNGRYNVSKSPIYQPVFSPSGSPLAYRANEYLPANYTYYDLLSNFLAYDFPLFESSISSFALTNTVALGTIARNIVNFDSSSITSSLYSVGSILTNSIACHFTIFNNSSPLMDFYNSSGNVTNQYYHFLTNYYIKVSTGQASGSASESHTNWFNRIEMLLGALVFRDSNEGSFSPGSTNTDGVESAYDSISQSLATAVEIPSSFQDKIENAEQSILDYMREWHAIISSGTLGSHFTLCDVRLSGFDSEPTRDGSPFDGRMNLSIPIDGSLKNFLDVSRALSTVCFITLFLILSLKLIIFLLRACASITRVCYALFMAIAGH